VWVHVEPEKIQEASVMESVAELPHNQPRSFHLLAPARKLWANLDGFELAKHCQIPDSSWQPLELEHLTNPDPKKVPGMTTRHCMADKRLMHIAGPVVPSWGLSEQRAVMAKLGCFEVVDLGLCHLGKGIVVGCQKFWLSGCVTVLSDCEPILELLLSGCGSNVL
jgi:hypothetical protein